MMRIHSDHLTWQEVYSSVAEGLDGVFVTIREHGSRSHKAAFEVSLEGNGYAKNTGKYGADQYENGATWDEWGVFLARLFDKDPNALAGSVKYPAYRDSGDFHYQTGTRFADLELPEDTHKRHNWQYGTPGYAECNKCSATKRWSY